MGDLLRAELGLARLNLELLHMEGGVIVLLDKPLADKDGVLEVVAAPRHERHEHVAPQCEFAVIRARAVRENLSL